MTHTHPDRGQYLVQSAAPLPERPTVAPKSPPPASGAVPRHEHWTYSVGRYNSFLYWPTFADVCEYAFSKSPDVEKIKVHAPDGFSLDVTRAQWDATRP